MRLVQYYTNSNSTTQLGIETDKGILNANLLSEHFNSDKHFTMESILEEQTEQLSQLSEWIETLNSTNNNELNSELYEQKDQMHYLPVIQNPEKIICVGMNYMDHVKQVDGEVPLSPILYNKFKNALAAHEQEIPLPPVANHVDFSAELVVVIGKEASNVWEEDVDQYIFGYTVGNNLSDRYLQYRTSQWMLGETLDYFAPIGPALVTKDEISDLRNLDVVLKLNNEIVQNGNTKDMIFDIPMIVSYLSKHITLKPGDLIFTGTPKGVILGRASDDRSWLTQNDLIEITISDVGTLKNQIK